MSIKVLGRSIKAVLLILIFSVAQITVLLFSLSRALSEKTERLESGLPVSFSERVFEIISGVLMFPLNFIQEVLPAASAGGYWGYMLLALNSLLWGFFLFHIYVYLKPRES